MTVLAEAGSSQVVVAFIAAVALVASTILPVLLSRSSKTVKLLESIKTDLQFHRRRDQVRFNAVFRNMTDSRGALIEDPWPDQPSWTRPESDSDRPGSQQ